jgi:hypothetical protein
VCTGGRRIVAVDDPQKAGLFGGILLVNETRTNAPGQRRRQLAWAAGLFAAGAVGGILFAVAGPAAADANNGVAVATSPAPSGQARGNGGQRAGETLLTGTDAEKATAAAVQAVPGATVDRVETDADGAAYEAHVTKSDGTKATVKFDKDFTVTGVEEGNGAGAPKASPTN